MPNSRAPLHHMRRRRLVNAGITCRWPCPGSRGIREPSASREQFSRPRAARGCLGGGAAACRGDELCGRGNGGGARGISRALHYSSTPRLPAWRSALTTPPLALALGLGSLPVWSPRPPPARLAAWRIAQSDKWSGRMSLRGHMEALFLLRAPRRVVLALQKGVFITVDSILTCLQPASNFVAKLNSYDSFFSWYVVQYKHC